MGLRAHMASGVGIRRTQGWAFNGLRPTKSPCPSYPPTSDCGSVGRCTSQTAAHESP